MFEDRKKLVVWSGGLDSTTILDGLAKSSTKENPVLTLSFEGNFLDSRKVVEERRVRKNYLRYAKKKGYFIENNLIKVNADITPEYLGWAQQVFWMSFMLPYIPDDCDVYLGFIQGDGVWLAVSNFYTIFNEFRYVGGRENIALHFPFSYKKKWEVLKEFRAAKIPHNCSWTCELPIVKSSKVQACGRCNPCISLSMAKKELVLRKRGVRE